jgi:hypothetical protein
VKIAVFGLFMQRGGRRMFQLPELVVEVLLEHLVEQVCEATTHSHTPT